MNRQLIIVDAQNDFIDGVLGTDEAVTAVYNIRKYLDKYASEYDFIWATQDSHTEKSYQDLVEGRYIPIHCIEGTKGREIHSALSKYIERMNRQQIINKSVFTASDLFRILRQYREMQIDFVGFCTDICVISNALAARSMFPKTRIRVIKDCCAGTTPEKHNAALEVMESCLIEVV